MRARQATMIDKWKLTLSIWLMLTITHVDATVPKVDSVTPSCGSLNGGTRITIYGSSFARNFFNFGKGNENLGSRVELAAISSHGCELHPDGSHETQIMCYTTAMPAGEYDVKVSVDGEPVSQDRYCSNPAKCKFTVSSECTPTITSISPFSGMPGGFLEINGDIKTIKYGSNEPDEFQDIIRRVYYGGQKCELRDQEKDEMFGISLVNNIGRMRCQTGGTYIGDIEVSFLVSNEFGRSQPDLSIMHIRRNGPAMYQAFTEISSISQSKGSTQGGTRLTITGRHFDETNTKAKVFVGGQECEIVEPVTDTTIVCNTPADTSDGVDYFTGGRGLYSYVHYGITDRNDFAYNTSNITHVDLSSYEDDSSADASYQRLAGFFVPPFSGKYEFFILPSGTSELFLSNTADPNQKVPYPSGGPPMSLQADAPHYFELNHVNSGTGTQTKVSLKARLAQTDLSEEDTGMAEHEIQDIVFTSSITKDIQIIDVVASGNAAPTNQRDVQTMTISGNLYTYFAIGLDGIYTVPLQPSTLSSGDEIESELKELPNIGFEVEVVLQRTGDDVVLVISSSSPIGKINDYECKVVGGDEGELVFTLVRTTLGVPSQDSFSLSMNGIPTPPIPVGGSGTDVAIALSTLIENLCHPKLHEGTVYDFESPATYISGRVIDEEPFCGRYSVKNPSFIYHKGPGEDTYGLRVSSSNNRFMCFAYKGLGKVRNVRIVFTYFIEGNEKKTGSVIFTVNNDDPMRWNFACKDIFSLIDGAVTGSGFFLEYIQAFRTDGAEDLFIDHVMFNRKKPLADNLMDGVLYMRRAQVRPNGYIVESLTITQQSPSRFKIVVAPFHCGYDLPLFEVAGATKANSIYTLTNGGLITVAVTREQTASPPIGGFFSVTFKQDTSPAPIPVTVDIDTDNIVANLATISVGFSEVTGSGTCSAFTYRVKMVSTTGDQPLMEVDTSQITGTNVRVKVNTVQNGGLWFDPIMGDLLRTHHTTPQVIAFINDIPTRCTNPTACTFEWSSAFTPTVSQINPNSGYHGNNVSITGTGFDDSVPGNNVVIIGTTPCTVISVSTTEIYCTINNGPTGEADVKVYVAGKGLAETNVKFTYVTGVDSYSSSPGSVEGGTLLTIDGFGFTSDATITLNGRDCIIVDINESQITCKTPQASSPSTTQTVDVIVSQPGNIVTAGQFTYDPSLTYTPVITAISASTSPVWGGDPLTIDGQGFGNAEMPVTLGGVELEVVDYNDTKLIVLLPALSHGSYQIYVDIENKGYADLRSNSIPDITYTFQVNSMTPTLGSLYGGTDVLITGDGFSTNKSDIDVTIGRHGCHIESAVATEIKCRIDDTGSRHVISATGIHKNYGVGFAWNKDPHTINVGDYIIWTWDTPFYVSDIVYGVHQTATASDIKSMDGGFSSSTNSRTGSFTHRFTEAGTYFYWTGFMDSHSIIYFRGTIHVTPLLSHSEVLSVTMHGNEAVYNTVGSPVNDAPSCSPATSQLTNCQDATSLSTDPTKFNFQFLKCYSPYIDSISQNNGTTNDVITLTGDGFGDADCQNEVAYGESECTTVESASDSVDFHVSVVDSPPINALQMFHLRVANLGYALTTISDTRELYFHLNPLVENITPLDGSKVGGTSVTITGSGFVGGVDNIFVNMKFLSCVVESVKYTEIVCETHCGSMPDSCRLGPMEVTVTVGGVLAECIANSCSFVTVEEKTAVITDLSPGTVSEASTQITVTGEGFGVVAGDLVVDIGGEECVVSGAVTDTSFTCTVGRLPVGRNVIDVYVANNGKAASGLTILSQKIASITSPSESSTYGGAVMTLSGNGFVNGDTSITVGGDDCPVIDTSFDEVTCTLPAQPEGSYDVVVTSRGNAYDSVTLTYSSAATPDVTSITPSGGQSGDSVTIDGIAFKPSSIDPIVTIGGVECIISNATDTTISCNVGNQQTGSYDVLVFAPESGNSNENVTFTYRLGAFTISPSTGSNNGGQKITLSGSGFLENNTVVTVCGEECTEVSMSASEYVCITPSADDLVSSADCDVVATVEGVSETDANAYSYDPSLVSTITSVNPSRGGTGGGTPITVTGTNFGTIANDISVRIASVTCIVQNVTDTEIICRTGAARSADALVSVQRSGWGEAVQTDAAFEYIDVWSSPYTWGGASPPVEGEFVIIPAGQKILLDVDTAVLKMLLIQGGQMIFDEANVELQAENILITDDGLLQIGSSEKHFPYNKTAIITMHGHLRSKELPIYGTKTLAVREGTLNLYGAPKTPVWTRLSATAKAGNSTLQLEQSVNWQAGDEIVIATTGHRHSQKESEVHVIREVSADGLTLTLESPLSYEHIGITGTFGSTMVDFRAEVGVLNRNVIVRGYRNMEFDTQIEACPKGFNTGEFTTQTCFQGRFGEELGSDQFGAQIMIHQVVKNTQVAQAHLENVELTHVGQAFRLGRYPIHFHLNGDMDQSFVRGCSIHTSFNRAVNVHGSHNVMVEHNVIYNVMGGAFFLEDGDETGNTFQYNLAVFVRSSTSLRNDDITPAAFWATNPNNTISHNAIAGGTHFGTWYRMHKHPDGPGFDPAICPQAAPLGEYRNNTAHSLGWFGLWIFETYVPRDGAGCTSAADHKVAQFYSLTAWNCEKGAEGVNSGSLQFRDFVLVNNEKAGYEGKLIVSSPPSYDSSNGPGVFDSVIVAHYDDKLKGLATRGGIIQPYHPGFLVENVEFYNFNESRSAALRWTRIDGICGSLCGGFKTETSGLGFINSNNKVAFEWESEGILFDLDGTLTGHAGYSVAACTGHFDPDNCTENAQMSEDIPGCVCTDKIKLVRFSFNNILPTSLNFKDAIFTNQFGSSHSAWERKRITHKKGWSMVLMANNYYSFSFENAGHVSNISFDSAFYNFDESDFLVFTQFADQKPDTFMLDGITALPMEDSMLAGSDVRHGDWFYNVTERSITYAISHSSRRKRDVFLSPKDFKIFLRAIRCYYRGCLPPEDPTGVLTEPSQSQPWSDASTWVDFTPDNLEPKPLDDLTIPKDKWIIVDKALPPLGKLTIEGGLQFKSNSFLDIVLECDYIYITGRLIVGWSDDNPYLGNVIIRIRGSHATTAYPHTDGPVVGAKFIAVFGGLQLHGVDRGITKTHLTTTVLPGSTSITIEDSVTWIVGDDILISTTDYNAWHTEVFKISAISGSTITLNDTVKYRHIAHSENVNGQIVHLKASVALLTRSIRIEGEEYPQMEEESFGARVVVGQIFDNGQQHSGFAQVSNVEFYHTGQEGFSENYDARFSLTYVDVVSSSDQVRYSYVKKSTFHSGFNTAVGAFGVDNLEINDNTVHHTVGPGIRTESTGTKITNNLVTLSIWPGSYQDRKEEENFDYDGAIHASKATDLILANNTVAGSERVGYRIRGQACSTASENLWSNNMAHGCMHGVLLFAKDKPADSACFLYHGFTAWKNLDYGIYSSNVPSVVFKNNILVENGVSIFPFVIGPPALSHQLIDKTATIENNILIGKTSSFSESEDVKNGQDDNFKFSINSRSTGSMGSCGKIGLMMGTFSSSTNNAPEKPFSNMMAYQTIKGLTRVVGNTFANFGTCTGGRDHAIATNQKNDDGIHPLQISGTTLVNVDSTAKIKFHPPNVEKINSADCVDMDCDGLKKCMIRDLDGTFLGAPGTVLPNSAYEWDGDRRHGLGDYRIPLAMLTTSNGDKIDVNSYAPNKGIYKTDNCTWVAEWNAFLCGDSYDWRMLIIESMDSDTETRRLSPVAIYHPEGYVDLINGAQDHGWCSGYTCRRRISTFQALVTLDEPFDIFLSSTNPKVIRYLLLNSGPNECVRLGMWYMTTNRLEVSVDSVVRLPKNGYLSPTGGFRLRLQDTNHQYMPDVKDKINGEYYISQAEQMIFWIQCGGSSEVTVTMKDVFIVAFTLPAMSEAEFFGERIIENLAAFLGMDPNKVRIVNIVEDTSSSGRRKRSTDRVTFFVEIADNPGESNTVDYETVGQEIINQVQLGRMSEIINATILFTAVQEPNSDSSTPLAPVPQVGYLVLDTHPRADTKENEILHVQPKLKVTDTNGDVVNYLGSITTAWEVEVSIKPGGSPHASLTGDTRVTFTGGWANFTNLVISHKGTYILEFQVVSPPQASNFSVDSLEVTVVGHNIGSRVNLKTTNRLTESPLEVEVYLVDKDINQDITDIDWAGHSWTAVATIFDPNIYTGMLNGTRTVTFDPSSGKATFNDLQLSKSGDCPVLINITSDLGDYEIKVVVFIDVLTSSQRNMIVAEQRSLGMKFPITYDPVRAPFWKAQVRNYYSNFPEMRVLSASSRSGSLIITLDIEASLSGYNSTLETLCSDIENSTTFTFDGTTVAMSGFLTVDGISYYGVSCGTRVNERGSDDSGLDTKYIIIIAVLAFAVVALICILLAYKFYFHSHAQATENHASRGLYTKSDLLTDTLLREGTLSSLKSRPYTPPFPPASAAVVSARSFDLSIPSPTPSSRRGKVSPEPYSGKLSAEPGKPEYAW